MHWGVLLIPSSQEHLVAMPTIWDNKVPIWVVPTELPNFTNPFSGCYQKVNGIRWLGRFLSWDEENYNWLSCADRGGIDENGEMTEPIRFEVAFYEMGADGYPGKEVYRKEFDVLGKFTGVSASEYDDLARIYEFSVELDETICLESGFFFGSSRQSRQRNA